MKLKYGWLSRFDMTLNCINNEKVFKMKHKSFITFHYWSFYAEFDKIENHPSGIKIKTTI